MMRLSRSSVRSSSPARRLTTLLAAAIAVAACGSLPAGDDVRPNASTQEWDVTIPAGTALSLRMTSSAWSDTSRANDPVSAELIDEVWVHGRRVLPFGVAVSGLVTSAEGAGRIDERAHVTIEFTSLETGGTRYDIDTESYTRPPAVALAGGNGTTVAAGAPVAAERNVRIGRGSDVTTRLTAPLRLRSSARRVLDN